MADVQSGLLYRIVNAKGGTVIDLSASNQYSVAGWGYHGGSNQIWEVTNEHGGWTFKSTANGKYLAIDDQPRDALPVIGSNDCFVWHLWPDEEDIDTLRICVPDTVFNVDLSGNGNPAGGTPIELWGRWNAANQTWRFERV